MSTDDLNRSKLDRLARLLAAPRDGGSGRTNADLATVLRYQLDTPLVYDLGNLERREGKAGLLAAWETRYGIRTFADLLSHPRPPLDGLEMAKRFAKAGRRHESSMPAETATFLYYAAIAAALVRLGRRITNLTDEALQNGFAWVLRQPWAAEPWRPLFEDAQRLLSVDTRRC